MSRIAGTCSRRPAQVERSAVHHQQHDRRAGRDDGLQQLQLAAGQLQRRAGGLLADHVLPLADHDDRDVGAARPARPRAAARRRRRTPPGRPACCRRTCRTSRGTAAARAGRRARTRPRPSADPVPDPVQHGDGLVEVEVEAPTARGCRAGSRRAGRSRRPSRALSGVERQQVALVAQQHGRALGGDPGHLAVRGVAEHLRGARPRRRTGRRTDPAAASPRAPAARSRPASPRPPRPAPAARAGGRRPGRPSPSPCRTPAFERRGPPASAQVGGEAVRLQAARPRWRRRPRSPRSPTGPRSTSVNSHRLPGGRDAVEVHVRRHHVAGAGLDRGPERREVDVPQLGVGEVRPRRSHGRRARRRSRRSAWVRRSRRRERRAARPGSRAPGRRRRPRRGTGPRRRPR